MSARSELVHLPALINLALAIPRSKARMMICHGSVYVNDECIGLPDMDIDRDKLRQAVVRVGRSAFYINALGNRILRHPPEQANDRKTPSLL